MKSLKIVHCANFSESKNGAVYYAIDRKISNGLIRNGHFVYDFSYREIARNATLFRRKKAGAKKMNQKLLETINNIKPDLLLLGHSELVTASTLKRIKESFPHIKIAMWWVDPFENISHIHNRLLLLDAFFATTDPEYYQSLFKEKTNFYYMPNLCDASIESSKSFENENHQYDLIFIGREDKNRIEFIAKLNGLQGIKYKLFGNTEDSLVLGNEYLQLLYNAKMAINYSRYNDISLYSSDRLIQLTAQGVLVFTPRIPNLDTIFGEDEVIYFDDFQDLENKIQYYLNNDIERVKIAKAGYNKAHSIFNEKKVTKSIIDSIYD